MEKIKYFVLGIVLIIISVITEGLNIFSHVAGHLYSDFTVELVPHIFILGVIIIGYGFWKQFRN